MSFYCKRPCGCWAGNNGIKGSPIAFGLCAEHRLDKLLIRQNFDRIAAILMENEGRAAISIKLGELCLSDEQDIEPYLEDA